MTITLSDHQNAALYEIMQWFKNEPEKQYFVLAGYAGTGKSTLAKFVEERAGKVIYLAYTGKAVDVLRKKTGGVVSTIHGALYRPKGTIKDAKTDEYKPVFELRDNNLHHYDLVIVDEYSMLPPKLFYDLLALSGKVLFLGDPFQLPPIGAACPIDDNSVDAFLTEIHRQALENPLLHAATQVRLGEQIHPCRGEQFSYIRYNQTTREDYLAADQVIVGKNATRRKFNNTFRKIHGFEQNPLPVEGDKMICLRNDKDAGLFNGMIGTCGNKVVQQPHNGEYFYMKFTNDENRTYPSVEVWDGDIRGRKNEFQRWPEGLQRFDYGYAITCHKAQGSEFPHVLIMNEPIGQGQGARRWLYTAITRASEKCVLVQP